MSNKTQKNSTVATASAPKKSRLHSSRMLVPLVVGFISFLILVSYMLFLGNDKKPRNNQPCLKHSVVQEENVDDCLVTLEIVQDDASIQKGLSGRASMPSSHGMLFVFQEEGEYCFWMKDMKFYLDIIWFNANKEIVYIEPNIAPETYPTPFCSSTPAQYVLELHAGAAQNLNLKAGQKLQF